MFHFWCNRPKRNCIKNSFIREKSMVFIRISQTFTVLGCVVDTMIILILRALNNLPLFTGKMSWKVLTALVKSAVTATDLLTMKRQWINCLTLLSGEGCFQPGARFWKGGCPNFVRALSGLCPSFVRTLSGLVRKIYRMDFYEILHIVYCYGLVVPPLVWSSQG